LERHTGAAAADIFAGRRLLRNPARAGLRSLKIRPVQGGYSEKPADEYRPPNLLIKIKPGKFLRSLNSSIIFTHRMDGKEYLLILLLLLQPKT